jgi:hypothetical protein
MNAIFEKIKSLGGKKGYGNNKVGLILAPDEKRI